MFNREHRLLAAVLIDNIGNGLHSLVVGKILFDATGSVWAFGLAIVFEYVLGIFLGVIAGPMVDRGSPQKIAATVDYLRGFLLIVASCYGGSTMLWLVVLVINAGKPFARSASFALIPQVVHPDRLTQYYSRSAAIFQIGQLLGVAAAGPILAYCGTAFALAADGATYVVSAVLVSTLRTSLNHHQPPSNRHATPLLTASTMLTSLRQDWTDLILAMKGDRALAYNLVLAAGDFLAITYFNLMLAPLVALRFHGDATWLTILDGAFALAAIAGAFLTKYLSKSDHAAASALLVQALALVLLGQSASGPMTVAATALFALANVHSLSLFMSSLQHRANSTKIANMKGRIAGMRHLILAILTTLTVPVLAWIYPQNLSAAFWFAPAAITVFAVTTILAKHTLTTDETIVLAK